MELIDKDYLNALVNVVECGEASVAFIQAKCDVGFSKANRILGWLEKRKYVSKYKGKPRKVRLKAKKLQKLYGVDVVETEKIPNEVVEEKPKTKGKSVDPIYVEALRVVITHNSASISLLQRKLAIGYNKAGQILEWLEEKKYVSEFEGAKARKVFITREQFEKEFGIPLEQ